MMKILKICLVGALLAGLLEDGANASSFNGAPRVFNGRPMQPPPGHRPPPTGHHMGPPPHKTKAQEALNIIGNKSALNSSEMSQIKSKLIEILNMQPPPGHRPPPPGHHMGPPPHKTKAQEALNIIGNKSALNSSEISQIKSKLIEILNMQPLPGHRPH